MSQLNVQNLNYKIGDQRILQDMSFTVPKGQLTCIIGPNGAGKSHLLKALAGLLRCEGEIYFGEETILKLIPERRAKILSWLDQSPTYSFNYSVLESVMMGRFAYHQGFPQTEDARIVTEELEFWGLCEKQKRPLNTLSQGELQKVYLARTLVAGNPLLLFDEPDNFLDIKTKIQMFSRLKDICRQGRTIVSIFHNINDVNCNADSMILLKNGKIQHFGLKSSTMTEQNLSKLFDVKAVIEKSATTAESWIHFS